MTRAEARHRRHLGVRKKIYGTSSRPRLAVFRSNRRVYAQIIDDHEALTLVTASSLEEDLRKAGNTSEVAAKVGELIAERALEQGIEQVVFDRGGYLYHGKVKALAEAARSKGLKF